MKALGVDCSAPYILLITLMCRCCVVKKLTVMLMAIAIVLSCLPFLWLALVPQEKRPSVVAENYVVRIDDDRFLVVKPPSWRELFNLALRNKASYYYITWYNLAELQTLYSLYTQLQYLEKEPCKLLIRMFTQGYWE